jgi:hypothetical protein
MRQDRFPSANLAKGTCRIAEKRRLATGILPPLADSTWFHFPEKLLSTKSPGLGKVKFMNCVKLQNPQLIQVFGNFAHHE